MTYYDINYTSLSDGTILVQYRSHDDDDNSIQPTYQALRRDMASAISYIDKLNAEAVKS
jgi:hypothetical protein